MRRAAALGFDFLLAPPSLAAVYAPAELTPCARSGSHSPGPQPCADDGDEARRDLVWLQRPLMTAEGGVIMSSTEELLDREHALFLRQRIAAVRAAGEGRQDRCVLLEIELDGAGLRGGANAADFAAGDEDDVLESFVISLGKTLPKNGPDRPCATRALAADPEKLHRFLLLLRETGCDGVSLALPDPLNEVESFGDTVLRSINAL
ncbi:MAG: hypothetical protein AB7R90_20355 [Reyranellaceae bacterium]